MKRRSGLYDYLEKTGVLRSGSKTEINLAKQKYWSLVRKEWRKKQRQACKSYTVFLTQAEQRDISKAVEDRGTNTTAFIKQSALQIARNSSGTDKKLLGQIREMFFEAYAGLQKTEPTQQVISCFTNLEKNVLKLLQY